MAKKDECAKLKEERKQLLDALHGVVDDLTSDDALHWGQWPPLNRAKRIMTRIERRSRK